MNTKPPSTYALKTLEPKIPTVGLPRQTTPRSPVQTQEPKTNPIQPTQMTPDPKATTIFQTLEQRGNTMFQTLQNLQEPRGNTMLQNLQNLQEPKANTGFPNQQTLQEPKGDAVLSVPIHKVMEPAQHRNQQLALRSDRHLYSPSDDNLMMRQIQATHAPDGREVDVRPLLHVVEDILQRAGPSVIMSVEHANPQSYLEPRAQAHSDDFDEKTTHQVGFIGMLEALAYTIHNISCEISCKSLGGADAHTTTVSLFNMLNSYSWDAKVVLVLAAFAVSYGEFWLLAQLYPTNQLAKSIALLKQLPNIMEHNESLRSRFDALNILIKAMLDVTKCIVDLSQLPSRYITPEVSAMSAATAHVPTAAYWTIRSAVACMAQIISLIGLGHEYMSSTSEVWELSSLAHKVNNIHGHLSQQLGHCYQYIGEKRHIEAYQTLIRLFETPHIDNMKILRALFYSKDDLPLVNGYGKKRVTVDILRRKNVLLLISDLSIPREELSILEQLYKDSRPLPSGPESPYEVVWIPILDTSTPWNEAMQKQFENMQLEMPWHTVYQPSQVDPAVVRYVKEVWHFVKRPLLVVLDPQGRVVCPNALHMMWIWGIDAFPFTSAREEALWRDESWRLELLVNGIDSTLLTWIPDGRYICLYGGEDIAWIRKFTNTARAAARAAGITLEMIYVGKSNPREKVRRNNEIIATEKLSHSWQDLTSIWFFWVRLESMMYSKMQLGKTVEKDPILGEILRLLGYDSTNQGWAIISRGSSGTPELAKGNGEMMLTSFTEFDQWKEHVEPKGFIPALNDHLKHIHTPHHCNHLKLPGTVGRITETIVCAECGRAMEKFYMYECCTE